VQVVKLPKAVTAKMSGAWGWPSAWNRQAARQPVRRPGRSSSRANA
jgi:hypothetical protein